MIPVHLHYLQTHKRRKQPLLSREPKNVLEIAPVDAPLSLVRFPIARSPFLATILPPHSQATKLAEDLREDPRSTPDFLSSIEIVVVDRTDILAMQVRLGWGVGKEGPPSGKQAQRNVHYQHSRKQDLSRTLVSLCFVEVRAMRLSSERPACAQGPCAPIHPVTAHQGRRPHLHPHPHRTRTHHPAPGPPPTTSVPHAPCSVPQNWAHVETVLAALNRLPREQHGTDIMRVRDWYLEGRARHYRQTLLLGSYPSPDTNALMRTTANHAGAARLRVESPGVLGAVIPQVGGCTELYGSRGSRGGISAGTARGVCDGGRRRCVCGSCDACSTGWDWCARLRNPCARTAF